MDPRSACRESCAQCLAASGIAIDDAAIDRYILKIERNDWDAHADQHGVRWPLQFDSLDDELSLLATLALLNFLSGYRLALHRLTGRGAYSTILSLVLSAYLSSSPASDAAALSAEWMLSITAPQLAELAQIRTHTEEPHPTLGNAVRVGVQDPDAAEILALLVGVLHETGEILRARGQASLGTWLREVLERQAGDGAGVVRELSETFPAFRDVHAIDGSPPVVLLKKAFWLVTILEARFRPRQGDPAPPLTPPSTAGFPVFADNVLPSMLLHHGILSVSRATDPDLRALDLSDEGTLDLRSEAATKLRAAAVHACARIVGRAQELARQVEGAGAGAQEVERGWLAGWTEPKLDAWMWNEAKREGTRDVGRVAERGTVYY